MINENDLNFEIPIDPVSKGRPIFGNGRVYTPSKTKEYENSVRYFLSKQKLPAVALTNPISLTCEFFIKRPKKTKFNYPATRPDLDNYLKAILDAGNEMLWRDDNCICEIHARKVYTDSTPKIRIKIENLK